MNDFEKGYCAYNLLEETGLEATAKGCQNPIEFKRGYWQADNEMLQVKDDQERVLFESEDK
jgi:hypothetical protein